MKRRTGLPEPEFTPPNTGESEIPPSHKWLASELVAGCINILREPRPQTPKAITAWESRRHAEQGFIGNPKASAAWCEIAGIEWDVVISRAKAQGLLAA
jgi:hypothetical protein